LPMHEVDETRSAAVARWNAKAERAVAKLRKDHPTAVIVAVTKRRPA